jgi:hypothetical protein
MAIYDYLPVYNFMEANNLKGLQPGFVVAQMEVKEDCALLVNERGNKMFENGHICSISRDGIDLWAEGAMFIHYTDPLNTLLPSDKYFAVNVANENPRLVQLIPGDEWMSTIDYENDAKYAEVKEELMKHIVKLTSADKQSKDDWFAVETMADGETKGYHYMYLG